MELPGFTVCSECTEKNIDCCPKINKRYCDPAIAGQPPFVLVSFVPAGYNVELVGKLDKLSHSCKANREVSNELHLLSQRIANQKLFAVCKVRAVAFSETEAKELARDIIKTVDSLHKVYTVRLGHPFPIHNDKLSLSADVDKVTLQDDTEECLSQAQKRIQLQHSKEVREVEQRTEEFKADLETDPIVEPGSLEEYMHLRYKCAMFKVTTEQVEEQLNLLKGKLDATVAKIKEYGDTEHKDTYMKAFEEKLGKSFNMEDKLIRYLGENI
ncbi:hypothetical protein SDDV_ORF080 [Scale drop disease virus]|nr:hypothetical protein SDDV_ORF080 [Scale drop disease virus]